MRPSSLAVQTPDVRRSATPTLAADGTTADAGLVARARAGDVRAFEALIRFHGPHMHRLALRMLSDRSDAEDATQEAYLRAWRSVDRFRGDSSFGTWLHRVVVNTCSRQLTRRRRTAMVPDTLASQAPGPARTVMARGAFEELEQVLGDLPPGHREPLVLRAGKGCTYAEIAEVMAISTPAVRSRLHRARQAVVQGMQTWS